MDTLGPTRRVRCTFRYPVQLELRASAQSAPTVDKTEFCSVGLTFLRLNPGMRWHP